jgi:hypothetical protein
LLEKGEVPAAKTKKDTFKMDQLSIQSSHFAEALDAEDFGVSHLLVHTIPQVLKVCQTPLVLV